MGVIALRCVQRQRFVSKSTLFLTLHTTRTVNPLSVPYFSTVTFFSLCWFICFYFVIFFPFILGARSLAGGRREYGRSGREFFFFFSLSLLHFFHMFGLTHGHFSPVKIRLDHKLKVSSHNVPTFKCFHLFPRWIRWNFQGDKMKSTELSYSSLAVFISF